MQLKCVLIDDEPLALEILKQYIGQFPSMQLIQWFTDAVEGAEFLKNNPVDLLFVDINMPDLKGTDLVRGLEQKPMVIFTTAYKNYAVEGFDLDAIDYLVKPIELDRFARAIQKATEFCQFKKAAKQDTDSLYVRSEYQLVKILFRDIEYIESVEDYLKIYLTNGKSIMTLMTMKAVFDKLLPEQFARIHRSYIVPLAKIRTIVNRRITLHSGMELPVSSSYMDVVRSWMK